MKGIVRKVGSTATDSAKLEGKTLAELMLAIYPIGSIYMSTVDVSPATLFGGTWSAIDAGRFLVAAGTGYDAGSTGGEEKVVLTAGNLPNQTGTIVFHGGGIATMLANTSGVFSRGTQRSAYLTGTKVEGANSYDSVNYSNGGASQAHNNMPPYLAVYMWQRVA